MLYVVNEDIDLGSRIVRVYDHKQAAEEYCTECNRRASRPDFWVEELIFTNGAYYESK